MTFVVIDGWTITVASVGDSRCILDTQGGVVSLLTVDHRLEENAEERERVTASGGEVGRLNVYGGNQVSRNHYLSSANCYSRKFIFSYILPLSPAVSFGSLVHFLFVCDCRLVPCAAGQVDYVFLGQSEILMLESLLFQYHMSSKLR